MHQSFNQYKSLFNKVKYKRYINFNKKIINRIRNRKQKHPIVSIITVVKNDPYYLEKTIKSVINQTYNNIEYIIIDGKSKKKTTSIIKKYKKKISIILSENDKGIYDAMNKGIVLASGEIISIINSGDLFFKNAVKNAVKNLKKVDYLFGPVKRTGDRTYFNYKPNKINHKFNIFPSHSVSFFVKRRIHEELGLYNISFKLSADYDFIFKLIKNRKKFTILKKKNLFGKCQEYNFSRKFSTFDHLNEELNIRLNNNQNIFYVFLLYLTKLLYFYCIYLKRFFF